MDWSLETKDVSKYRQLHNSESLNALLLPQNNGGIWLAFKGHCQKSDDIVTAVKNSWLKKTTVHPTKLSANQKIHLTNTPASFRYICDYDQNYWIVFWDKNIASNLNNSDGGKKAIQIKQKNENEAKTARNEPKKAIKPTKETINVITSNEDIFVKQLTSFIFPKLINKNKFNVVFNKKGNYDLLTIGSYLGQAPDNCYIYGTGLKSYPPEDSKKFHRYTDLNVLSVRGNITHQYVEEQKIKQSNVIGDATLLIVFFYEPKENKKLSTKIGVLPKKEHFQQYQNIDKKTYHLINPNMPCDNVIDQICQCHGLISEQLYPLIVADSYHVPNLWLNTINEESHPFEDYFSSQGRPLTKISDLSEMELNLFYKRGNKINLDSLLDAFPFR